MTNTAERLAEYNQRNLQSRRDVVVRALFLPSLLNPCC